MRKRPISDIVFKCEQRELMLSIFNNTKRDFTLLPYRTFTMSFLSAMKMARITYSKVLTLLAMLAPGVGDVYVLQL